MSLEAILTPLTFEQYRALPNDERLARMAAAERSRRRWAESSEGSATRHQMLRAGRCTLCASSSRLTIDHIVPLVRGGSHERSNLRVLCGSCNSRKGAR